MYDLNSFTRQRGELPHNASIPCNLQFTSNDRQNRIVLFIFWGTKHHTVLCNVISLAFKDWKPFVICWFSSLQIPVHPHTTKHGVPWTAKVWIHGKRYFSKFVSYEFCTLSIFSSNKFYILFSDIHCSMSERQASWQWRRKRGLRFGHPAGTI